MKVSTNLFFDRATNQLGTVQSSLSKTQEQLSTGKQITKPSDAPDKASVVTRLESELARQKSYQDALSAVEIKLTSQETALRNVSDVMARIKELTLQAANNTTSVADRQSIAQEVASLRDQVLSLANSQDSSGSYLFAGSRVNQPAFGKDSHGQMNYLGDQTRIQVAVGDNRRMNVNRPGSEAFTRVVRDQGNGEKVGVGFFQALDDLVGAIQSSDKNNMQRGLAEVDSLSLDVSAATARVGSDLNVVDSQKNVLDEVTLRLKTTMSAVQDLDYTEAITQMNKDQLALEAAQSSFAKISKLSLFNYLN
jgi:flagellar hook-associated protein 3 FlgL